MSFLLGEQGDGLVGGQGLVGHADEPLVAQDERDHHEREDHAVAEREHRKAVRHAHAAFLRGGVGGAGIVDHAALIPS